jgi:D-alanyl-D-alanine carboxypeptidase/D-alanyl-D-alanine-endopeptidase (penicillin-binding protein 4)
MTRRILALALAAAALPASAREPAPGVLKAAIDPIVERPAFAAGFWGIEVRGLRTGKVLYSRNAGKNLKPASTMKLLTTAAALAALSPDARIRTTVETAGRLDGLGRILGDVYLVGRGDANLSGRFVDSRYVDTASRPAERRPTAELEALAEALRVAGVRRIEGRLIGHEGLFKGDRRGDDWAWDDLVWCYGAEVSALSFNDNCADLRAAAGERIGEPLVVDRSPASSYYSVTSTATTSAAGTKSDLTLVRDLGTNVIRLSGTHPLGEKPWEGSVALEDPARYAASVFAELLEARGIRVTGGVATGSEPLPAGARELAVHESAPLSEALKAVNKPSQNLHTEMLLRLLGAKVKGEGSVEKGHEALREFLERVGVAKEPGALQDASGLSRSDLIAPHEIVSLLVAMARHPHAAAFRESLPLAGVDGTLRNRMKGAPAERRVWAKTGTIRHVNALAGYATTRDGEELVFSIVANHHTVPSKDTVAAIDEIVNALVTR